MNKMKTISLLLLVVNGVCASSFEDCLKYLESKKARAPEFINKTMEDMKRDYETERFLTKEESELLCKYNRCGQLIGYHVARMALSTDDSEYEQQEEEMQKGLKMTLEYLKEQQKKDQQKQ